MNNLRFKLRFSFGFFVLFFAAVITRAFYLQVVGNKNLQSYSSSQYFKEKKIYPNRGFIFDRNGEALAVNVQSYNIFTYPHLLKDKDTLKKLAQISSDLQYQTLENKTKNRKKFTWLARRLKLNKQEVLKIKDLKGIFLEEEISRFYPHEELAAQTLGFVGIDNKGLAGIEHRFDDYLKGRPIVKKYFKDARGKFITFESKTSKQTKRNDLYLTLDKDLQYIAEDYLREAVEKHAALRGGVGIMDAATGEILAMANYPSFNPMNIGKTPASQRKLSFISDPFEPGSIFKTLTIASAFMHGVAHPDSNYYCENGHLQIGKHSIGEAEEKKTFGWLSVSDILKYSSNIGTTKIAFDLTYQRLRETIHQFGIGEKTGIELPGESKGIFKDQEKVRPIRLSNISFGQGLALTGVQLLSMYASIANGGYQVHPTVLASQNSLELNRRSQKRSRLLPGPIVQDLERMLTRVVEEGTASLAKVPYFVMAGKTSTAQRPSADGKYEGYISAFIGYPVNVKKRFVVLVYVDHPQKNGYYGNVVAGPVFQKISKYLLYKHKDYESLELAHLDQDEDSLHVKHSSKKKNPLKAIPNFIGLDKKTAKALASDLNIEVIHQGYGLVKQQSLKQGIPLAGKKKIILNYHPPSYD